jgi:hypothetical protein
LSALKYKKKEHVYGASGHHVKRSGRFRMPDRISLDRLIVHKAARQADFAIFPGIRYIP